MISEPCLAPHTGKTNLEQHYLLHSGLLPLTQVCFWTKGRPRKPHSDCVKVSHCKGAVMLRELVCSGSHPDPEPNSFPFWNLCWVSAQIEFAMKQGGGGRCQRAGGQRVEISGPCLPMQCYLGAETSSCFFPKDLRWGCWPLGEQRDLGQRLVEEEGRNIFLLKEG